MGFKDIFKNNKKDSQLEYSPSYILDEFDEELDYLRFDENNNELPSIDYRVLCRDSNNQDIDVNVRVWSTGLVDIYTDNKGCSLKGCYVQNSADGSDCPTSIFHAILAYIDIDAFEETGIEVKWMKGTDILDTLIDLPEVNVSNAINSMDAEVFKTCNISALYLPNISFPTSVSNGKYEDCLTAYINSTIEFVSSNTTMDIPRVVLGGTSEGYTWREELIPILEEYNIDYLDPSMADDAERCFQTELEARDPNQIIVYTIEDGVIDEYSLAMFLDACERCPENLIFCNLWQEDPNQVALNRSMALINMLVGEDVEICTSIDQLVDAIYSKMEKLTY